ncbi:MAG: RIP metalloprotease RseP [Acholeplasma sp.]|nr:RIP metalloprotease RseP [Acholeplasma sp.]
MVILEILIFLIVLGAIILIHEFGHFYFARKAGILCHEFSMGMGPAIYQKRKGEIVYSVRAIPLGGYVSMAGEEMGDMIKKGQTIGLRVNEHNAVTDIILHDSLEYDIIGKVIDFDLYGENFKELFISIEGNSGETIIYKVLRDAKYRFKKNQEIWVTPAEKSYESKTIWQRFLVVFAGPATNFILAFLILFVVAFFIGKPSNKNVVGAVSEKYQDVLKKGDVISKVNGVSVDSWQAIGKEIYKVHDDQVIFTINNEDKVIDLEVIIQGIGIRNQKGVHELIVGEQFGRTKDLKENDKIIGILMSDDELESVNYESVSTWMELLTYAANNNTKQYVYLNVIRNGEETKISRYENIPEKTLIELDSDYIIYSAGISQSRSFNILYPLYYPFQKMGSDIMSMLNTIGLLIGPKTGVGVGDLAGPIGIFSLVSSALKSGVANFFIFVAFLSVNIGFLNLLPIPALDGGRLVFLGYEAITKKKVNKKVENTVINITFILLLILIVFVSYNDILRLFS